MPQIFVGLPATDREALVEALVHFLASTGTAKQEKPDKKLIGTGKELYQKIGCVVCHGTRDAAGGQEKVFATTLPLGDLKAKYTLASLRAFLENPHKTRPSGRMPLLLNAKEAQEIANYLIQGSNYASPGSNLAYAYYEGRWDQLPDFDKLTPNATGITGGFDVTVARQANNMAMRFEGYLKIEKEGDYRFHVNSDDGSKLWLDGKIVVSNDGIHAPTTASGEVKLTKGMHKLVTGVFNAGGGVELGVEIEGPGIGRQSANAFLFLTPEGNPSPKTVVKKAEDAPLEIQPALVAKGRLLFGYLACASCHQLNDGKRIDSTLKATPLKKLKNEGGCLAPMPKQGSPWFALDPTQRTALAAALTAPAASTPSPAETLARTLTTFNCYACHERGKLGGPLEALNTAFTTSQPEMGDEARIPPSLNGVGAKLNPEYLRQLLDKGAHDRPYMHTRMPGFGNDNVGALVALFNNLDPPESAPKVKLSQTPQKVKAEARQLIGGTNLACIKCHTFAGNKAEGVQGMDMTIMAKRLKHDWYHNYMLNPSKYRPGTRMPAAWPERQVMLPKFFGGSVDQQIEGIWVYLSEGNKALLPVGMKKQSIPLIPTSEAIVYRNFIEGAGPRGIAVGYPEQAHLAFDANNLRLAMLWQGPFIDASRHWTDRGVGFEGPLGDNILNLPTSVSFAALSKDNEPWPTKSAKDLPGYHFQGYRLSKDQRPTFLYTAAGAKVEDFPNAVITKEHAGIRRTLVLSVPPETGPLFFRAVEGTSIKPLGDGWFQINGEWKMRIEAAAPPQVRQANGRMELLVPVRFENGRAQIVQEFQW
jgi:mono/diheme cytochrome c family protein